MTLQVICLRIPGTQDPDWRVAVDNRVTSPSFNSKGAAMAYAAIIQSGRRKPEFAS